MEVALSDAGVTFTGLELLKLVLVCGVFGGAVLGDLAVGSLLELPAKKGGVMLSTDEEVVEGSSSSID